MILVVKRVIVAGSRYYNNYEEAKKYIDFFISNIKNEYTLIFLSGDCCGADKIGEKYAIEKGHKIEIYPAEWEKYGKSVGPLRNKIMAEKCDYVICFWDGKSSGTKSMIECEIKIGKPVKIKFI